MKVLSRRIAELFAARRGLLKLLSSEAESSQKAPAFESCRGEGEDEDGYLL